MARLEYYTILKLLGLEQFIRDVCVLYGKCGRVKIWAARWRGCSCVSRDDSRLFRHRVDAAHCHRRQLRWHAAETGEVPRRPVEIDVIARGAASGVAVGAPLLHLASSEDNEHRHEDGANRRQDRCGHDRRHVDGGRGSDGSLGARQSGGHGGCGRNTNTVNNTHLKGGGQLLGYMGFYYLIYGLITTTESLLPAHLCLVTLFSTEQCSQLERFLPQHVQMVNKTSIFITELTGNFAETSRVNRNTLYYITFPRSIWEPSL